MNSRSDKYALLREFEVGCTIEIEHTANSLHAHVTLDDGVMISPGDEVTVLGEPINPTFGDTLSLRRRALVRRASRLGDWWARLTGRLELTELLETSFSEWRKT